MEFFNIYLLPVGINFIWAAHQVHHSSEEYNLTTALRQSVLLSQILWIFYLPVALIVPPAAFLVHFQLTFVYQFWIHTEFIKTIGPFEYILNTASHHRVHHGRNRYCIDKNYAGVLIIWDRIFGTFEAEKEEDIAYGLVQNINTFESLQIQYGYTFSLLKTVWSTEGWRNKLSLLFKGPGWSPGKPRLGNTEDIPEVEFPVKKYDPQVPFLYNLQGSLHFFAIQATYIALQRNQHILPPKVLYGVIMYIMFSVTSIGSMLDRRPYAVWLELLRCALYIPADYYFTPWIFVANPAYYKTIALLIRGLFIATGILWLKTVFDGRSVKWNPQKLL
ncbi:alkylglycerol monooxygenase [Trichonephila inaurata madagascariensis]|uniref:Alkylglycerol monooxygenase n=1 Tax=Trichonephila inaurata madagascariensis TaxID=2747483 RepID=A0A8X7C906_9ARAC|nr:alkylglycerol monooxygenase [Trichonephila inaurata madagascariensis]